MCVQGVLNGREIFMQDNFVATDDAAAGGADEYKREDDDEAKINEMFEQVSSGHQHLFLHQLAQLVDLS